MKMHKSGVVRKLIEGNEANCFIINLSDANDFELAALAGFDFVRMANNDDKRLVVLLASIAGASINGENRLMDGGLNA